MLLPGACTPQFHRVLVSLPSLSLRQVRAYAIPGGSEEIMLDLGMRQALKGAIRSRM